MLYVRVLNNIPHGIYSSRFHGFKILQNSEYKYWAYIISKALFGGFINAGAYNGGNFASEKRSK